jgi:hypothetical protein
MAKRGRTLAISVVIAAALVETAARLSGIVDIPTYAVDDEIGYLVNPNQSGEFLDKNAWAFNDRSMAVAKNWTPGERLNLLLIGNSVIMGGNPYPQAAKVGPLLQRELGDKVAVWPSAVGGWSTVNETVYLERNPDVVSANRFFVWEVMTGGFSQLSRWRGDYVFPRQRPLCATCYVIRRYVVPRVLPVHDNELPPVGDAAAENVSRFERMIATLCHSSGAKTHGVLLFYPTQVQLNAAQQGQEWFPDRRELERIAGAYGLQVIDLSRQPEWKATDYRDGTHPTADANALLAHIIAGAVRESMQSQ